MKKYAALLLLVLAFSVDARTARSEKAKSDFAKIHACPSSGLNKAHCPGYVIDHINPLACGGLDKPANMQWQTIAAGKAKDRTERRGCKAGKRV